MIKKLLSNLFSIVALILTISPVACNSSTPVGTTGSPRSTTDTLLVPPGNVSTGIVISPSTKSPWPELAVYEYPLTVTTVKVGKEFNIGLDFVPRLGQRWAVKYEENILSLKDQQIVYVNPSLPAEGTDWFRFKTISEGNAFVTFDLISISEEIVMRLTYIFFVTT